MRVLLSLGIVVLCVSCVVRITGVKGDGKITTETRTVAPFTAIEVSGVAHVDFTPAAELAPIEVTCDSNLLPIITTNIVNSTLVIDTKEGISPTKGLKIKITGPAPKKIEQSGASSFTMTNIDATELTVEVSGASSMTLSGKVTQGNFDASGASNIKAADLVVGTLKVDASGASSIKCHVTGSLDADGSGASSITYRGEPTLKKSVSGASSIKKAD